MKRTIAWRNSTILTSSLLLTATVFGTFSAAVNANPIQKPGEYLLAQASDTCRLVTARNGLNVRQEPTVNSQAIGIINNGRTVTIQNRGTNGWVPITAPVQGYVYGGFLATCETATVPPPSTCRRVVANQGLPVREQPTPDGTTVGVVARGRRVTIESLGANGWVPITVPLRGYVQSENLAYCRF